MKVDKEFICRMYEIKYLDSRGMEPEDLYEDADKVYPRDWFEYENYDKKIEMLTEAIKDNKLIMETDKYKEYLKGKRM